MARGCVWGTGQPPVLGGGFCGGRCPPSCGNPAAGRRQLWKPRGGLWRGGGECNWPEGNYTRVRAAGGSGEGGGGPRPQPAPRHSAGHSGGGGGGPPGVAVPNRHQPSTGRGPGARDYPPAKTSARTARDVERAKPQWDMWLELRVRSAARIPLQTKTFQVPTLYYCGCAMEIHQTSFGGLSTLYSTKTLHSLIAMLHESELEATTTDGHRKDRAPVKGWPTPTMPLTFSPKSTTLHIVSDI